MDENTRSWKGFDQLVVGIFCTIVLSGIAMIVYGQMTLASARSDAESQEAAAPVQGSLRQEGCLDVPANTLKSLADDLADDGVTLRYARAFPSPTAYRGQLFHYIAAEVEAPGYEGMGDIGVWTAFDLDGGDNSGPTMAVGPVARRVSQVGTASQAPIVAASHPGVAEAIRCVANAITDTKD